MNIPRFPMLLVLNIADGMSGNERQLFSTHQHLISKASNCQMNWKACSRQN